MRRMLKTPHKSDPGYSDRMAYGWHDSLGPGGPSLDLPKFEEARRRRRPPRSRWIGAAAACFMVALGVTALATQSLTDALWVTLVGGGLWLLASGLVFVRRALGAARAPTDGHGRKRTALRQP